MFFDLKFVFSLNPLEYYIAFSSFFVDEVRIDFLLSLLLSKLPFKRDYLDRLMIYRDFSIIF